MEKSILDVAMATPADYFSIKLDLEFFAHSHHEKGLGVDSYYKNM